MAKRVFFLVVLTTLFVSGAFALDYKNVIELQPLQPEPIGLSAVDGVVFFYFQATGSAAAFRAGDEMVLMISLRESDGSHRLLLSKAVVKKDNIRNAMYLEFNILDVDSSIGTFPHNDKPAQLARFRKIKNLLKSIVLWEVIPK